MPLASPRQLFLLAFLACVAIMGGALYLEHVVGLEACPLCVVQRIFFILIGLTCLAGAIQGPGLRGRRIYSVLVFLLALGGRATAARQVWLQTVPLDQLPACLPSLDYMMQALPSGSDPPGPAWHRGLCPGELDAIHPEHSGMEPAGVRCLSRLLHRAVPPTCLMRAVAWSFVSSRASAVSIWRKPERMRDTDQTSV